jgi:uncharacterized protein YndB with AHSA1/START domain
MKWVKRGLLVVIGLPIFLLGLLLAAGLRPEAGKHAAEVSIAARPAAVFAHFSDADRLREWTGSDRVEALTPPPLAVGSRLRFFSTSRGGSRNELLAEVREMVPGRSLILSFHTPPGAPLRFEHVSRFDLEETETGTRVVVAGTTRYEGFWLRALEPLATPSVEKRARSNLGRLKRIVESEGRK